MKWNELKDAVERCVSKSILDDYPVCIELNGANAEFDNIYIEIDNGKQEIIIYDK